MEQNDPGKITSGASGMLCNTRRDSDHSKPNHHSTAAVLHDYNYDCVYDQRTRSHKNCYGNTNDIGDGLDARGVDLSYPRVSTVCCSNHRDRCVSSKQETFILSLHLDRVFLLLVSTSLLIGLINPTVQAQVTCQIAIAHDYPRQAVPGQRIQVATHVSGSCISPFVTINTYTVRVDATDAGAIVSSNSSFSGYESESFSVTIINSVVAPSMSRTWSLSLIIYVFAGDSTEPSYTRTDTVPIRVGQSSATSEMFTLTTILLSTVRPSVTVTQTESVAENILPQGVLQSMALILLVMIIGVSIALRKRRSYEERTRVY